MARVGTYSARAAAGDPDAPLPVGSPLAGIVPALASGSTTASLAGAVVADSGQLAAGTYRVEISLGFSGTLAAGKHLVAEHRNAANAANTALLGLCPAGDSFYAVFERVVVAANERIRAALGAVAAAAGEVTSASIRVYLLAS